MKKILLLVSTVILSLLFVNYKVHAQEYPEYPNFLMKTNYYPYIRYPIAEHNDTYEYEVDYSANVIFDSIEDIEYYLFAENVSFKKGIDIGTNSYEIIGVTPYTSLGYTAIYVKVTLLKSVVNEYSYNPPEFPTDLFRYYSAFYITYISDTGSIEYDAGYQDGFENGYDEGFEDGYDEGYDDGYNDGLNDFNVADYFGTQNIAKATGIEYYLVSDPFEPSTSIVVYNAGRAGSNILLDKPYLIVIIKKNIYDYVVVRFDDLLIYHFEATYFDIGDYNIYIFNLTDRLNTKYNLEIRKENVTTTDEANEFLNDVVDNIYFSHASKLLTSSIALQFYDFGYIAGLEKNITGSDAYRIGYDNGYNRGYIDGKEDGYELGYEDGFDYGKTVEYEHGYKDGYNDGYSDGINKPFFSNFHVWIVPAIIIVVIAGIFVGYRRERYGE